MCGGFRLPFGWNLPPVCRYAATYLSIHLQPETNFCRGRVGMSSSKSYLQPQTLATRATEIQSKSNLGCDWLRCPPFHGVGRESNNGHTGVVSVCCHLQTQCWPLLPLADSLIWGSERVWPAYNNQNAAMLSSMVVTPAFLKMTGAWNSFSQALFRSSLCLLLLITGEEPTKSPVTLRPNQRAPSAHSVGMWLTSISNGKRVVASAGARTPAVCTDGSLDGILGDWCSRSRKQIVRIINDEPLNHDELSVNISIHEHMINKRFVNIFAK